MLVCTPSESTADTVDQFEVSVLSDECPCQSPISTFTACRTVSCHNLIYQRLLKAYRVYLTIEPRFAGFQLYSRVNCTAEKKNWIQISDKMGGQG